MQKAYFHIVSSSSCIWLLSIANDVITMQNKGRLNSVSIERSKTYAYIPGLDMSSSARWPDTLQVTLFSFRFSF